MKQDAAGNRKSVSRFLTTVPPILLLVILALVPLASPGPNAIRLLFISLVWVTASVAWNILGGFAGQVSFGFAVFYGLGAYTTAISLNAGLDRVSSLTLAGLVGAITSLLVGLPTFRLRGPYFAIATIGVSEAVRVVMTNLAVTGGASGYRITEKGAFNQHLHFYMALGLAAGAVAISMRIRHSKLGLALISIREDEDAASDLGVNPYGTKLLAHALAAARREGGRLEFRHGVGRTHVGPHEAGALARRAHDRCAGAVAEYHRRAALRVVEHPRPLHLLHDQAPRVARPDDDDVACETPHRPVWQPREGPSVPGDVEPDLPEAGEDE